MSSSTTTTTTTPTPPEDDSIRSGLIAAATGSASLIRIATTADPDLAAMLSGQSAIQSRALYGPLVTAVMTWLLTKYALSWDAATVNAVTGFLAVAVGMIFRYIAKAPITGFLHAAPPASLGPKS
jgi:hypothetical protein